MQRFLVRRPTSEVFIWTETLAKRSDMEEVYADSAKEALGKEAMPDARRVSVEQLDAMNKADLMIFGKEKLVPPLDLPVQMNKADMAMKIKARLFGLDDAGADAHTPVRA